MSEEQEVYQVQKKPKPKGRRHSGNTVGKTLTIRFKSREQYERICRHAESQGLSINEWCVKQLLAGITP
jgi:predicted HicB family RNase H-like nuclease